MLSEKSIVQSTNDTTIGNVIEITLMSEMSKSEILAKMVGKVFVGEFRNCVLTPAWHYNDNLDLIPVVLISANATDKELSKAYEKIYRLAQILNEVLDLAYTPMRVNHTTVLVGLAK